jgi:hypothetical protein
VVQVNGRREVVARIRCLNCKSESFYGDRTKIACPKCYEAQAARIAELGKVIQDVLYYTTPFDFFKQNGVSLESYGCICCAEIGDTPAAIKHAENCPAAKARALLARKGQEDK